VAKNRQDRILVIDRDPDERDMLVEAALVPSGYKVNAVDDGGAALTLVQQDPPDLVILDLHLVGLSGRDVMAALNAQSADIPVILLANQGAEKEALQAFRLGAKDYVVRPFREAELIQAVERALKEVRLRRERETLVEEVRQAANEAERHLRELKTLMSIGKSITTLQALSEVFHQVILAAITLTKADAAGFFLKDDRTGQLFLRAGENLSPDLRAKMGQPVEDDLASLVMTSREAFTAGGEGLARFHPAQAGVRAVIYAPLMVHDAPIGVLWVANNERPVEDYMKDLMTALADYASIAVVNTRLLATMQERNRQLEDIYKRIKAGEFSAPAAPAPAVSNEEDAAIRQFIVDVRRPLTTLLGNMNMFRTGEMGRLRGSHQAAVDVMHRQLTEMIDRLDTILPPDTGL
jgi:two-component system NtrC family sensor kinase